MIYDTFQNMNLYCHQDEALYRAICYARDCAPSLPEGIYEVEGRDIFARVVTYETAPARCGMFEGHRDYIDVQVLLSGREQIDVALAAEANLIPFEEYNPETDMVLFEVPNNFASINLIPGRFAVFYPDDVHRPGSELDGPICVKKICMKVHYITQMKFRRN